MSHMIESFLILDYKSDVSECLLVAAVYTNESCHTCVYTCMCLMRMCDSLLDYRSDVLECLLVAVAHE